MSLRDFIALSPLLIVATGALVLLLQLAFVRSHRAAFATFLLTLAAASVDGWIRLPAVEQATAVTTLLRVDRFSLFFCLLFFFTSAVCGGLGYRYLRARLTGNRRTSTTLSSCPSSSSCGEFYFFVLLATLGACTLVSSQHFASFFLALELISLALYPLLAFPVPLAKWGAGRDVSHREAALSLESGIKYLITSALATALALFGIALMYAATGNLQFSSMDFSRGESALLIGGFALLLAGVAFKLSLVPFHAWTADVYEGAPTPVTAFIATLGKTALLAILLRLFSEFSVHILETSVAMISLLAVASMLGGNLLALRQRNVKRLLAYSAIAHMGYFLVVYLVIDRGIAREATIYYLVAYTVTTLCAFSAVSLIDDAALSDVSNPQVTTGDDGNPFQQSFYRGLFWRSPTLSLCLAAALLSLAGIPFTVGFIGKFYLITAALDGQLWGLLGALIVGSALGLFYYLRLLLTLVDAPSIASGQTAAMRVVVDQPHTSAEPAARNNPLLISRSGLGLLLLLTALLLIFGIYPQLLINGINAL
ncbi:NADH-quinone oxidoreductase subunit N [Microbulbifer sp. SH-1]|uniref:NADH-quinone oxidoreductase subunit N n=1 Tax=Microbulbifer sp. SH-1 TaxID=2681547 RepID=UPI00140AA0BA|nr:NADH-quinone oxidoreductase subunit N [Microbulbifer sp. SH-1]QIL89707.1 NADH-quinone oxidoreductase subunit N [Microbulbifer sp. SH-1]